MANQPGPDTVSGDYAAMKPYWDMVDTILAGAAAMRKAGEAYLPKFPNETDADYVYRRDNAKFTNIYRDIVEGLAAKPFAEETQLADRADARFRGLAEDIDGRGNNLHVFAAETFFGGINYAVDWILVDFTRVRPRSDGRRLSLADEQSRGLRPYWVRIPGKRVLAVYSDVIAGKEIIVHARLREDAVVRDGFSEATVQRIRVFDREPVVEIVDGVATGRVIGYGPATFQVWEHRARTGTSGSQWEIVDAGPITIGEIPLVPFVTGRRIDGTWQFEAPMRAAADLQVEHFQAETALKSIKELTAFPMLAGNGVAPALDGNGKPIPVPVGPRAVLYAPPSGESGQHSEWGFIEPTAESLRFLADQVEVIENQLRELGRQPLTAQSGITVVAAALASQKASSAVQAWALALKNALEEAWVLTAKWLNMADGPEVRVYTDFAIESGDDKGPEWLRDMAKRGRLSQRTEWSEARRRNVLSADFDADGEEEQIAQEAPDPDTEEDLDAAGSSGAMAA